MAKDPKLKNVALVVAVVCSLFTFNPNSARAQGTAFTYQGRLNAGGGPVGGSYDLQFTLFTTNTSGVALAKPVTNAAVAASNGLFTTTIIFGPGVFTGVSNWLDVAVRTNGPGAFTELTPRQAVTATPYAIMAGNVPGPVSASQLSGTLPAAQLPASVLTNGASGARLTGVALLAGGNSFTGDQTVSDALNVSGNLNLPATTGYYYGGSIITAGGVPLLQSYGTANLFVGPYAGNFPMTGIGNTGIGGSSLGDNGSGSYNTSIGYAALANNSSGNINLAVGYFSLFNSSAGQNNIAFGYNAERNANNGDNNMAKLGNAGQYQ